MSQLGMQLPITISPVVGFIPRRWITGWKWILYMVLQALLSVTQGQERGASSSRRSEIETLTTTTSRDSLLPATKIFCQFNRKEYSPGDVWYPPVPTRSSTTSASFCIKCNCLNTGRFNCTQEACLAGCDEKDPCCKTCSAPVVPNTTISRESDLRPVDGNSGSSEETPAELEEDIVSCLHQGKIYRNGEVFTANVSGLPIAAIDQCMQCQCQNGMVLCAMKPCSSFKCSLADLAPSIRSGRGEVGDTCCHRCAAWNKGKSIGDSNSYGRPKNPEVIQSRVVGTNNNPNKVGRHQQSTSTGSFTFESGTTGTLNRRGTTTSHLRTEPERETQRIIVSVPPLDSSITFRDPSNNVIGIRPTIKPMEDCISSGIFYLHGSTWHPVIGPFGPMECVSCKCNLGHIDCGRLKCPSRQDLPCTKPVKVEGHCCPICTSPNDKTFEEGTSLCVAAKHDITAFKSIGFGQNDTEYVEFAFLRPRRLSVGSDSQVERHEWKLVGSDIEEFSTQYLSLAQFEGLRNRQAFTLLGATNEKNVEKFTRREKKIEKRCSNSRCNIRISGLERSLRLHKLISRDQCLSHERIVHTV